MKAAFLPPPLPVLVSVQKLSLRRGVCPWWGMQNAAEVASDSDDSTSPAAEHPPRIKFKRPDKTARHIMNVRKLSECYILAGTVLLHYIQ
jgi:hypothetical protein